MAISENFNAVARPRAGYSAPLSFFCAVCGECLTVDVSLAGETVPCISCRRTVPVPGFPPYGDSAGCAPVFSPEILSLDLRFFCRSCYSKLTADARWEGREMSCPGCGSAVTVPRWSHRPPTEAEAVLTGEAPRLTSEEIAFLTGEPNSPML